MRRISVVLTAVLTLASLTMAQETTESVSHAATVFGSLGGMSDGTTTIYFGGGEEFIWPNGLGIGADVGSIRSTTEFAGGLGLLTAGPLYEFRTSSSYKPLCPWRGHARLRPGCAAPDTRGGWPQSVAQRPVGPQV